MKSIISHIALTTKLLGSPISEAALLARVGRDQDLKIDYGTLTEVLRSYGFDNQLSKRSLQDIPTLALPATILLKNEEAAVITEVTYHADERTYHLLQTDGMTKVITAMQLEQLYLGFCWFIKPKV